ncbi:hypothetical protein ACWDF9_01930 [Streptomyces rubiginosohelvolus]
MHTSAPTEHRHEARREERGPEPRTSPPEERPHEAASGPERPHHDRTYG